MIAFACSHCGMKFNVKDEFAGRSTHCPTCKHPLTVPSPVALPDTITYGSAVGPQSTLATAGIPVRVSLGDAATAREGRGSLSLGELLKQGAAGRRFLIQQEIARGGMGAVHRAVDCDLRREIAVKYLLDGTDSSKAIRFVEEAQITGQLEHPNIVPIHELGVDCQKRLFFSMKMVKGRSLAEIFDELRANPDASEKGHSLTALLTALLGVCNALAYAHSRKVVHRDLKPANVMLGDFGEVYVMDWGLARVLTNPVSVPLAAVAPEGISATAALSKSGSQTAGRVSTSRSDGIELTQEGSVLGTPLYMPPEQAQGHIKEIDARSDVYSLGGLLYEMLTLQPPVEHAGGFVEIMARVIEGSIVRPEERTPQRVRQGKVPRELSAVAMRALAKHKEKRYPSVEAFRQDIVLYLDGRSVTAKPDTRWESFVKFVKRNRGASAGVGAAFLALLCSLIFISKAWVKTGKAYEALQVEQEEKQKRTREAVPALVASARLNVERREFDAALAQVDLALVYDEDHPESRLLRGQIHVSGMQFNRGTEDLKEYLRQRPKDETTQVLLILCEKQTEVDPHRLIKISQVLAKQQVYTLAERVVKAYGRDAPTALNALRDMYLNQINKSVSGVSLKVTKEGEVEVFSNYNHPSLAPLSGIPITSLTLNIRSGAGDLSPLRGMPLKYIAIRGPIVDLSPLNGMKLNSLTLNCCFELRDLTPLKGMPLTTLNLLNCKDVSDLAPLSGMPLKELSLHQSFKVTDLSPLKGMELVSINILGFPLKRLSGLEVLREMSSLKIIEYATEDRGDPEKFWRRYDAGEFK